MKRRTVVVRCAAAVCLGTDVLSASSAAWATESFPSRTVTLVVPNLPGGAIDILARLLEHHLHEVWAQPITLVYKVGGGTIVGTDFVAKSKPDGHTIGFVVTSHVINPSMRKSMPFDTLKDLTGVSLLATSPVLISARLGLPANNLKELIALAKSQPGQLTYASPGAGSSMHMAGEMLKTLAGIDMLHVPFNGSAPTYPEIMSGRVDLLIDPLFSSLPHVKANHMKPLAVISPQRAVTLPNVPTGEETVRGFVVQSVYGAVVPAGTPREVVQKINIDLVAAVQTPDIKSRMEEIGLNALGSSPEQFDAFIVTEIDRWAKVVKASGAQIE